MMRAPLLVGSISTIVAVLGSSGCSLFDPAELGEHEDFRAEFELVWDAFDSQYPAFGLTPVDWDESYATYSARIDTVTSQAGFSTVVCDMLGGLQDATILLCPPDAPPESTCAAGAVSNYDYDVLMSYLEPAGFQWFIPNTWGYAVFQDSIPYVVILQWTSGIYPADLNDLLELYPDAPALIIDQRPAHNGSQTAMRYIASNFNDEMRVGFYTVGRDGPEHDDLCDPRPYVVHSLSGHFDRPVAILIGERNSGAATRFACLAAEIPSVTLIGDTTLVHGNFSSGLLGLPGGWSYTMPDSTVLLADSATWLTGIGVEPDIFVDATSEDFSQGIDPVLEFAVNWAASQRR